MRSETWTDYVSNALFRTQEMDRQPLGGTKPEHIPVTAGVGGVGGKFVEDELKSKPIATLDLKSDKKNVDLDSRGDLNAEATDISNDQVIFSN
jgi:hypothetical protein